MMIMKHSCRITIRPLLQLLLLVIFPSLCDGTDDYFGPQTVPEYDPDYNEIQRIRGGEDFQRIRWFAHWEDTHLCGGVLVHKDIVMTTASCVDRGRAPRQIRLNSQDRFGDSGGNNTDGRTVIVLGYKIHPDWNGDPSAGADIAVLLLKDEIGDGQGGRREDHGIINFDGNITATAKFFVFGFGQTANKQYPKGLKGLFYDYVDDCGERYESYNPYFHLCADAQSDRGACDGDGGSPAVLSGTRVVVGLSSFSDDQCESQTIDVYTRVSTYAPWIQSQICELAKAPPSPQCNAPPCLFFAWSNFQGVQQRVQKFFYGDSSGNQGGLLRGGLQQQVQRFFGF